MEFSNDLNTYVIAVQILIEVLVLWYLIENWFAGIADYYKRKKYFWAFISFWNPCYGFWNGVMADVKKHCGVPELSNTEFLRALNVKHSRVNAERQVLKPKNSG